MEIIHMDDLDYASLDLFNYNGKEADLFKSGKVAYKLYKNIDIDREAKETKVEILNKLEHINLIIPNQKIYNNMGFNGYTMEYFDSCQLSNVKLSNQKLIKLFKKISIVLKWLHKNDIIVGDLNLTNILYKNGDFKFIDLDSFKIGDIPNDNIPSLTHRTIIKTNEVSIKDLIIDNNFDNLSLILCFLYILFNKKTFSKLEDEELEIGIKEFNENQKQLIKHLYYKNPLEINIPYFDDIF